MDGLVDRIHGTFSMGEPMVGAEKLKLLWWKGWFSEFSIGQIQAEL